MIAPPFNDVRVRKALALTIDKAAIVELALFGQGEPTFSPIPPSHPYFNKVAAHFRRLNVAQAKKTVGRGRLSERLSTCRCRFPQEREQRVRLGVAVRDMARAAGIRINIERGAVRLLYGQCRRPRPRCMVDGYFARPTIDTAIYPFY